MPDWEVKVVTESGQIKNVRVDNYAYRPDAERAALNSSGAQRVVISNPKNYQDDYVTEVQEVHHHYPTPVYEYEDDNDSSSSYLDELEEEMYDLMCQIAMSEGRELPTIEDFYDYLDKNT